MSLMSDVFPARQRSLAVGFLYLGLALGQGAIFLFGGYFAAQYGWRSAYLIAGIPGILLALVICLYIRETKRGSADGLDARATVETRPGATAVFRHVAQSPDLLLLILAATCCSIASSITWMWMPSLLSRSHDLDVATTGIVLSIATGICSGLGSVVAGPLSSWIVRDGKIARLGFTAATVALLATPLGMTAIFSPSLPLAVAGIFGLGFMLGAWLPPAFGLALAVAPVHLRAGAMSVIQFSTNLFAGALAPFGVGWLSDSIGGENSLVTSMGLVFPIMFIAALAFFTAALKVRRMPAQVVTA
jgi:MFS family permease